MLLFHIELDRISYEILAGFKMDIGLDRSHVLSYRNLFHNEGVSSVLKCLDTIPFFIHPSII
jgi:hypothetical protein